MNDEKIQDLLLQMMQKLAYIEAKLDNLDEMKISNRIDALEAENREHDRVIKSLERRNDKMEQFVRNNMSDSKKQQTSVFISMGLAVFSFVLSLISKIF